MKVFCWLRKHIAVFVDAYCEVSGTKQVKCCTPMADSSQDSQGNLEHIYTPNTSVLHAPAHMVSSEMTRGYPMEQSFPLPTMASEPQQLLKLEVFGLFRKQDSGLSRAQTAGWPRVFSLKERAYSHTLSTLKTLWRAEMFPMYAADFLRLLYTVWYWTAQGKRVKIKKATSQNI